MWWAPERRLRILTARPCRRTSKKRMRRLRRRRRSSMRSRRARRRRRSRYHRPRSRRRSRRSRTPTPESRIRLNDAYAKSNDAVRNQLAAFFSTPEGNNPQLTFSVNDSQVLNNIQSCGSSASTESERVAGRNSRVRPRTLRTDAWTRRSGTPRAIFRRSRIL